MKRFSRIFSEGLCFRPFFGFILMAIVINLTACAPAQYRGWDGGDRYFSDQDTHFSNPKSPNRSNTQREHRQKSSECHSPYVVRTGDTLGEIADKCRVDMKDLARLNHLKPPYTLYSKQELQLPEGAVIAAKTPSYSPRVKSPSQKKTSANSFLWPMKKQFKYTFKRDSAGNNALVIQAPVGEAIYAVEAGEVVYSGEGIEHYGRLIILKHPDGYLTIYAHNDSLLVKEGETVKKGQLIATVGATGDVKEPQLFFEARYLGRKVDAKPLFHQRFLR